jgi:hypothetical protein
VTAADRPGDLPGAAELRATTERHVAELRALQEQVDERDLSAVPLASLLMSALTSSGDVGGTDLLATVRDEIACLSAALRQAGKGHPLTMDIGAIGLTLEMYVRRLSVGLELLRREAMGGAP